MNSKLTKCLPSPAGSPDRGAFTLAERRFIFRASAPICSWLCASSSQPDADRRYDLRVFGLLDRLLLLLLLALVAGFGFQPALAQSSLTNGLIGSYPFDGDATDVSGNGFNGIVYGAVPDLNRFGWPNSSFKFSGTTNQIRLNLGATNFTSDFSISVWVKLDDFLSGYPVIMDGDTGFIRFDVTGSAYLPTDSQRVGFYQYETSDGRQFGKLISASILATNQWYHLAVVRSGLRFQMYVNGTLSSERTESGGVGLSGEYLQAGNALTFNDNAHYFHGNIDDLRIYNRALSSDEVQSLLLQQISPPVPILRFSVTVLPGTNVALYAYAQGIPPTSSALPTYQWLRNGAPITNSPRIAGAASSYLTISNAQPQDTGAYSVQVTTSSGSTTNAALVLTIYDGDSDGDGLPNSWETAFGLNPNDPKDAANHPPGDKLTFLQKYLYGENPLTTSTDGSGISDYDEIFVYHGNPLKATPVDDGIPDAVKVQYGLNPLVNNANTEAGFDGVTYLQVYQYDLAHTNRLEQLDPRKPFALPGTSNYELINGGQHTNRYSYDRNDRLIGAEYSRGISIAYRYDGNGNMIGQTVLSRNSETNGLPVLWRYLNGLTNSTSPFVDSDGDGWTDYQEFQAGTDPNDPNSRPNFFGNPSTSIGSLALPFIPSNFVVGVGQLDGLGAAGIVIGADGNPGTNHNFLLVLTEASTEWPAQRVEVGAFGITSIAVGQVTNRPGPAIYAGLRQPGGTGRIIELISTGNGWQTNTVATSTNEAAYVLGVRGENLLASLATTNAPDGALYITAYSASWDLGLLDALPSNKGLGTVALWPTNSPAPLRILDKGGIELGPLEGPLGPTNLALAGHATQSSDYVGGGYPARLAIDGNTNNFTSTADGDRHPAWTLDLQNVCILDHLEIFNRNSCCAERLTNYTVSVFGSAGTNSLPVFSQTYNLGPIPPDHQTIPLNGLTGEFIQVRLLPPLNDSSYLSLAEVRVMGWPSNTFSLDMPPAQAPLFWRGQSLASGVLRASNTNSCSVVCGFADDRNANGLLDADDNFVVAEYLVNETNASRLTIYQQPVGSVAVAQSYGLASVNYLNNSNKVLFTGEPDGQVFVWTAVGATNELHRQLFSAQYAGKAWHALAGVQTLGPGEGLVGLMVDPASPNTCSVVFWPPQKALTPPPNIVETAPFAVVVPSPYPLGGMAVITIRLWDAEGNASTPFLQYQILGSTNWLNATCALLDGEPYSPLTRVAALPAGTDHTVVWNAFTDLGAGVVTNILLRARAEDFMLVGDWSLPTPFQVNTVQTSNTNGLPDWWQILYFGQIGVDPNLDSDGDGFTNWQEYLAGTNPTDPNSVLRITTIQSEGDKVHIHWKAGATVPQYLQRSTNLADPNGWQDIFKNTTPMTGAFVDGPLTGTPRFYRIRLGP